MYGTLPLNSKLFPAFREIYFSQNIWKVLNREIKSLRNIWKFHVFLDYEIVIERI